MFKVCRDDMPCEVKKYPIVGIFGGVEKVEKFIEPVRSQPDPDRFHSQSTITLKFGSTVGLGLTKIKKRIIYFIKLRVPV